MMKIEKDSKEGHNIAEELENVYLTKRLLMVSEDGVSTPLAVLLEMAKSFDTTCESEEYHFFLPEVREISWRIEMNVGKLQGVGEAPLRKLAAHMAAADILKKLKESSPEVDVPVYGLLPGSRISPSVFMDLAHLCKRNNHSSPTFYFLDESITGKRKNIPDGPCFKVYCKVGDLVIRADSDSLKLAKRLAARDMYETLSNKLYPEYTIVNGAACSRSLLITKLNLTPSSNYVTDEIMQTIRDEREQSIVDKSTDEIIIDPIKEDEDDESISDETDEIIIDPIKNLKDENDKSIIDETEEIIIDPIENLKEDDDEAEL